MAIDPLNPSQPIPAQHSEKPASPLKTSKVGKAFAPASSARGTKEGDTVNLSATQIDRERLRAMIHEVPEIREEKVKKLQAAIASGKYQVSSDDIARSIIQDTISNQIKSSD